MSPAPIRVVLVDDEEHARERLRRLLAEHDDVEVVGEADDGTSALARIEALRPDAVFLDIQMPGCDGLEVAASLPSPRPVLVFCTAYDQYAVDAFELQALDYLLKPVHRKRLAATLARIRSGPGAVDESIDRIGPASGAWPTRFLARLGTRILVVPERDVLCFSTEDGVTALHTPANRLWMQPSLADLERRLDPERFYRVSRATIVHLDHVREVVTQPGGQGEVRLADGRTVDVSRRRFRGLIERLDAV